MSYIPALVDVSYDNAAEERDTDSTPLSVSGPPAMNSKPSIATADCEHGFRNGSHQDLSFNSLICLKAVTLELLMYSVEGPLLTSSLLVLLIIGVVMGTGEFIGNHNFVSFFS